MPQETQSKALAFVRSLDDAGNVGHDEAFAVVVRDDTQIRGQRREGIIGDLRFGRADDAQERALACIGKSDKNHIGEHLQFHQHPFLDAWFARLRVARRLVGGRLEMLVALAAAASGEEDMLLPLLGHLAQDLAGLIVLHDRAQWQLDDNVLARCARALVARAHPAILGDDVFGVSQVQQGPQLAATTNDHMNFSRRRCELPFPPFPERHSMRMWSMKFMCPCAHMAMCSWSSGG